MNPEQLAELLRDPQVVQQIVELSREPASAHLEFHRSKAEAEPARYRREPVLRGAVACAQRQEPEALLDARGHSLIPGIVLSATG